MTLLEQRETDVAELIADIGEPVTWNGQEFQAIISAINTSVRGLGAGGFNESYDFTVKIPAKSFPDAARPHPVDAVIFDGRTYVVEKVVSHKQNPLVVLTVSVP